MSNVVRMAPSKSLSPDEYVPPWYLEWLIHGEEAGIAAADAIRCGIDPDVYWVTHVDEVFAPLSDDPEAGKAFLFGFIQSLLEEIK